MNIISFRLQGKMAHFRRYYSNSSALSYSVPPRTTVIGILAGLLGYERDSYYDLFNLEQCQIALSSRTPIKKTIQKMNLLKIENLSRDANGFLGVHSQTATELVLPQNIRTGLLDFQIWIHHRDSDIMKRLEDILGLADDVYHTCGTSVSLGTANHLGWIKYDGVYEGERMEPNLAEKIDSIIPANQIDQLQMPPDSFTYRLVKEDIPLEFDNNRRLTKGGKSVMIINLINSPIFAKVHQLVALDNGTKIVWMQ